MIRKASPTLIGLFILVGLALGVGAVLLFSSSRLFTTTRKFVLYFDSSLTGLDPGTAVKFRGVTIGFVKEVLIHFNQQPTDASLPVIIELNEDLLQKRSDQTFNLVDDAQLDSCVKRGLRGKLAAQSLLTGLFYVDLEFLPETPPVYHQLRPIYPEIPTAPSTVQIFQVDFTGVVGKLNTILTRLDARLGELEIKDINRGLTNLLVSLNRVVGSPELTNTLVSARRTLDDFRRLSADLRAKADWVADDAGDTLAESRATLVELRQGIQDLRDLLAPHGPLQRDLVDTLNQLGEAANSVAELTDFLSRHPNALLSGRKIPEAKP